MKSNSAEDIYQWFTEYTDTVEEQGMATASDTIRRLELEEQTIVYAVQLRHQNHSH